MRFQVPQFIEVESKIFGPLTLKQFIYLAGGAGVIFLIHVVLKFFFFTVLLGIPVAGMAIALAFYKVHNRPFIEVVENALRYSMAPKIYIWKKEKPKEVSSADLMIKTAAPKDNASARYAPRLTRNKLKDLAWSLDIKNRIK